VALLLLLKELADRGGIRLTAAHFDHRIRPASGDDARFVRALCEEIHVPLIEGAGDVPHLVAEEKIGLETAARQARRAFLEKALTEAGADVIATAHHADDQAETVLMHLFRGAGTGGAAGIRPRSGHWARPLLHVSKADLVSYLLERGQSWCTDETNAVPDTPRNRLRSSVLPSVLAIYPGATRALGRFAAVSAEESDYLDSLADRFLAERGVRIDGGLYALEAVPAERALICRVLRRLEPETDYGLLSRMTDLYFAPSGCVHAVGIRAERSGSRLYLIDETQPPEAFLGSLGVAPHENRPVYQNGFRQVLDAANLQGAELRLRRPGDWISPLGTSGSKSLSDYLIDRKLDRPLRDRLPLVARDSEVLWAVGVGISNRAALREGSEAVELTYIPKSDGGTRP
jgi:tRNA(Ile)-lysidine synthase